MSSALARRTTLVLGALYLALGVLEVVTHRDDTVPALLFWGISLLGGGSVVLAGAAIWSRHPLLGLVLVVVGAVMGFVATAWTLLFPLLVIVVIALSVREYATLTGGGPGEQRRTPAPTARSGGQPPKASA